MLDVVDDCFRSFACTIPFQDVLNTASNTQLASPTPQSCPKANVKQSSYEPVRSISSVARQRPHTRLSTKRDRKRDFTIFVDATPDHAPVEPASQRPKMNTHVPLMVRTGSANSTPAPSPRLPVTPLSLSPSDPFWLDKENWNAVPLMTPPPTPAVFPHDPTISTGPPPPPPQSARIIRPPRTSHSPPPHNMVLYDLLGLDHWRVSTRAVRSAWRHTALAVHPDQASDEERETATLRMQQVNAAREVLLNSTRRRQYHVDGVLPWAV
jgi:hypothetical protein